MMLEMVRQVKGTVEKAGNYTHHLTKVIQREQQGEGGPDARSLISEMSADTGRLMVPLPGESAAPLIADMISHGGTE